MLVRAPTEPQRVRGPERHLYEAWNDIVADGRGNTYVNNIGFDFGTVSSRPASIALVSPDGSAR